MLPDSFEVLSFKTAQLLLHLQHRFNISTKSNEHTSAGSTHTHTENLHVGQSNRHACAHMPMCTPWHIYSPSVISILTLTGSIHHVSCRGRGGDIGFAEMEEANTRKSTLIGNKSTSGESRTAARRKGGGKAGRKERKVRMGSRVSECRVVRIKG